ncbi:MULTISPECIES: head-tail adaptor protein [Clostridium]|uniref:head-tail adaptor protein n=1 Tax=Clostridium TaxID=1485 RepID=UPI0029011765|nr:MULTISPECIES: head-tail adaptor protein [Clostridium]MDU1229885.1 head-tail adaptor protein [Clostridium sp.]
MAKELRISNSDLKQIISIEKLSEEKNEYGILVNKYTEILNTKARVVNIDGSESDNNQGIQNKIQIEVYMRFNPLVKIKDTYRIKFNNDYFNITYIDNLDNSNKWLRIKGVKIE